MSHAPLKSRVARKASRPKVKKAVPSIHHEVRLGYPKLVVAGADEVGRGCLAGPVVAAALILPEGLDPQWDSRQSVHEPKWLSQVRDSKELTEETRERLFPEIKRWARGFAIGVCSVEEIDELNIYHASHLAIQKAVEGLGISPNQVIVDGNRVPVGLPKAHAIIKADASCLSVAAASILAKVVRDRWMAELACQYPEYGFLKNKGYPTPFHKAAIEKIGVSPHHRRSFQFVKKHLPQTQGATEKGSHQPTPQQLSIF